MGRVRGRRHRLPDLERLLLGPGRAAEPALPQIKFFKTDGVKLTLSDVPGGGGFTIEVGPPVVSTPLKLVLDANGIALTNSSSLKLTPVSVSVNNGALEVM